VEPEIVTLARRSREVYFDDAAGGKPTPWDDLMPALRRAWVRVALVGRPDLGEGLAFPPGHWLAEVFPIVNFVFRGTVEV
jgi:hypothetical protein